MKLRRQMEGRQTALLSATALAPLLSACGGGGSGPVITPPPPPTVPPAPPTSVALSSSSVSENVPAAIVGAVTVSDPNPGDSFTYSLTDSRFEVVSGQLRLKANTFLDFEGEGSVTVGITVTDSTNLTYSQSFTITVTDAADVFVRGSTNDTLSTGAGNDYIRTGEGLDIIDAGAGDDIIVVVGTTTANQYTATSITNPAGTGVDLSSLIALSNLNGRTISEAQAGEVIDGGTGNDTLYLYGTLDLSQATISNITQVVVNSDVTFATGQLGASGITQITGDGGSTIRIASSNNTPVQVDLSTLNLSGIKRLEVGANVTVTASSSTALSSSGISVISGNGTLQITGASNSVDLSGFVVESSTIIQNGGGTTINIATTGATSITSEQITNIDNGVNNAPTDIKLSNASIYETVIGGEIGKLTTRDADIGDSHTYTLSDDRFEVVEGMLRLKADQSLTYATEQTINLTITAADIAGATYSETLTITVNPTPTGQFVIPFGPFAGTVLPFNDPLLQFQSNILGYRHWTNSVGFEEVSDINLIPVWVEYSGSGVKIISVEDIDYSHPELDGTYIANPLWDPLPALMSPGSSGSYHGTATAGIISAEANNGIGLVGVAYGARITSSLGLTPTNAGDYDIVTNSTGVPSTFFFSNQSDMVAGWANPLPNGRNGLGSLHFISAGNGGQNDFSSEASSLTSEFLLIPTALTDTSGDISYSTFGSGIHVTVPINSSSNTIEAFTVDRVGDAGKITTSNTQSASFPFDYGSHFSYLIDGLKFDPAALGLAQGNYATFGGTSAAAPTAAGASALFLEASKNNIFGLSGLGWRDAQEILAISAKHSGSSLRSTALKAQEHHPWTINGADNVNGGGYHFSPDYGFGLLDVHAAVRLAETWQWQHTSANLVTHSVVANSANTITYGSPITLTLDMTGYSDLELDVVDFNLDITHASWSELLITVTSPSGTQSIVFDTPGLTASGFHSQQIPMTGQLIWTVLSRAFWGENTSGTWTITIEDVVDNGNSGSLGSITANFKGDVDTPDDTYFFTDDWAKMNDANGGVPTIDDSAGVNTLNLAAVSDDVVLDLSAGSSSTIDKKQAFSLGANANMAIGITGDGDDIIRGIGAGDKAYSMRGNDIIETTVLDFSLLDGGKGTDTLHIKAVGASVNLTSLMANNALSGFEVLDFTSFGDQSVTLTAADVIALSDTDKLTITGDAGDNVTLSDAGWSQSGTQSIDGVDYLTYVNGIATIYIDPDMTLFTG